MIVHQLTPILEPGAVGAHTFVAREVLRRAGYESEIFAAEVHPSYAAAGARDYRSYRGGADILVYQMAIGSVVGDFVLGRSERLVVNHHNLTPLRFFDGWDPSAAYGVVWGGTQLRQLAGRAALGIAVSHYNEADLVDAGFARTAVVPYLLDPGALAVAPDAEVLASMRAASGGARWLFVGRLAPNKAQHDVVKAFAAYRRFHDRHARLALVGGGTDGTYGRSLLHFVAALGLEDAVSIPGAVSLPVLSAYYDAADVLVVCSEHEGFCVPLVEAMHHRLAIVAYGAAAVPETLDGAGILLDTKDPFTVAAAVHRVLTDDRLRDALVEAGTATTARYDLARTAPAFVEAVTSVAVRA